jgi:ammonia channel protein AmtB
MSAIAIGGIAAIPNYGLLSRADPRRFLDVATHGLGGTVGALLTGSSHNGRGTEWPMGCSGPGQFVTQATAVAAAIRGVMTFVLLKIVAP